MIDAFLQIAPAAAWLRLSAATVLLLIGAVVLSHTLVARSAYDLPFRGWARAGLHESTVRWGGALVAAGLLAWGWELGWPLLPLALLGLAALAMLVLEGASRLERPPES